jgi:AraC-like DNA-binding protein
VYLKGEVVAMSHPRVAISDPVDPWADPYTREGLRPPEQGAGADAGFVVHEAGVFALGEGWNYRAVRSPFWRLYHNDAPGAALRVGGRRLELTPDLAWLVPAGVTFDCVGAPGPRHLWIHFSPGVGSGRDWIEPRAVGLTPPLKALVTWLRRCLAGSPPEAWTAGQVGHALLHAVFAACGPESARAAEPRLRALLLAIERRLADPPEVAEMAAMVHLSESRFARWFREERGESPAVYVRRRRVAEACRRLAFTDESVDQVAEALGFANRFHFSRVFKTVLGETPGAFKRRRGPR